MIAFSGLTTTAQNANPQSRGGIRKQTNFPPGKKPIMDSRIYNAASEHIVSNDALLSPACATRCVIALDDDGPHPQKDGPRDL